MTIRKYNFFITFLFMIISSFIKNDIITISFFLMLFASEIYCLTVKDYETIVLELLLLIPLLGITRIKTLPMSNIYFAIFGMYILFLDNKIAHSKKTMSFYILFILFDSLKYFLYFSENIKLTSIISVPVLYLSIYAAIAAVEIIAKSNQFEIYCYSFVKGTILSIIYGFITRLLSGGIMFAIVNDNILTRNVGASGDPNYFGLYIGLSIAFLIYESNKNNFKFQDYLLIFLMMFLGLSSSSRMYYVICIILILFMFIQLMKKLLSRKFLKTILIIILILFIAISLKDFMLTNIEYLISRLITEQDITNGRGGLIHEYLIFSNESIIKMLFGIGIPQYNIRAGIAHYAHNFYVELFVTQGLFGIVVLLLSIITYTVKKREFKIYNLLPLLIFLIGGIGVNYIEVDSFYLLMFFLIIFTKRRDLYDK